MFMNVIRKKINLCCFRSTGKHCFSKAEYLFENPSSIMNFLLIPTIVTVTVTLILSLRPV